MFLLKTQHSDAGEAWNSGPSVLSEALYHWATALLGVNGSYPMNKFKILHPSD